ncbi:MAG TPA: S41 family peptidase [Verrucomicrobiaceae bacterium]
MPSPCLAIIAALAASIHAEDVPRPIDELSQGALQSAFQILRRDYIRRDELTFEELNRAALQGLLERLHSGAQLEPLRKETSPQEARVHSEFLAPDIAYLRPETLAEGESGLFEKALAGIVEQKARHLILDLRATKAPGSFDEAALMLQCFVPQGELMFKMKQTGRDEAELFISRREPLWRNRVVVLIDRDTNNAAEAIAAGLKARKLALTIGEPTRGLAVRYAEVPLDDKTALRYAGAEMLLPDDSAVFKKGVSPMITIHASMDEKRRVMETSSGKSLKPFLVDRVRHRFNEAALVAATNPELDDYVRQSAGKPLPGDEGQRRDVVTQRALDLLQAGDFTAAGAFLGAANPPAVRAGKSKTEKVKP